ncbi:MAG: MgtC/SapB family protein [Thermoleophilaceae bacterium]|nr:MgtC/SapB family protein [Thermoleophilaceae bacterium]
MGKRSRKRGDAPPSGSPSGGGASTSNRAERDEARRRRAANASSGAEPAALSSPRRRRPGERPPAPWGNFPLTELTVLIAIVIGVIGAITGGGQGRTMLVGAMVLGSLGGLELSIREHFAGFRSHTTLLAGACTVVTILLVFLVATTLPAYVPLIVGALVFGGAFFVLRETFKRRSGGLGFR